MLLKPFEEKFAFWNLEFAVLFNSYYNVIGDKHPRSKRGLLTRPSLAEVLLWRKNIEDRVTELLKEKCLKKKLFPLGAKRENSLKKGPPK